MSIREFKLFNQSETAYIAEQVCSIVRNWSGKWFNDPGLVETEILRACELNDHLDILPKSWFVGEYDSHLFALYCPNDFLDSIYTNIVTAAKVQDIDLSASTYISRKLVNINIGTLIEDVCKSFYSQKNTIRNSYMTSQEFLEEANRYGSGYIYIKLSLQGRQFMVIAIDLSAVQKPGTAKNTVAAEGELHPAINAFGNQTVKLEAFVGKSVIDIKSLSSMAVGDVLTIDSGDNSDIDLHIDNKKVCTGKIGKVGNNFAIKINSH